MVEIVNASHPPPFLGISRAILGDRRRGSACGRNSGRGETLETQSPFLGSRSSRSDCSGARDVPRSRAALALERE